MGLREEILLVALTRSFQCWNRPLYGKVELDSIAKTPYGPIRVVTRLTGPMKRVEFALTVAAAAAYL